MTSIIKVDTIQDTSGNNIINENSNTITIGASGDTTNIVGTLQNNGAGVGGANTPAFSVYKSGNVDITDASATKYSLDAEHYDTDNAFDTSTYRFTVPSGKAGKYFFYGRVRFNKGGVSEYYIKIKKNGSDLAMRYFYSGGVGTNIFNQIDFLSWDVSCTSQLSVGDYVELFVYMNSIDGNPATMSGGSSHNEFLGYKIIE